jgi:hypothetical protein
MRELKDTVRWCDFRDGGAWGNDGDMASAEVNDFFPTS